MYTGNELANHIAEKLAHLAFWVGIAFLVCMYIAFGLGGGCR